MYHLCRDTVTIFRNNTATALQGCCLQEKKMQKMDSTGTWGENTFLLIVPSHFPICPGDKVCRGENGEKMTIYEVTPCYMAGKLCHWEGRGR